ncbi:MAG: hypothetical protein MK132_27475 [Lentisphaerales bacterium]|nr:hypothetical protein [Lentisphaerales bacterium]
MRSLILVFITFLLVSCQNEEYVVTAAGPLEAPSGKFTIYKNGKYTPYEFKDTFSTQEFHTVYKNAGNPRILVFLNKHSSEEIEPWVKKTHIENQVGWITSLENGFMKPLLDQGAFIVNRSKVPNLIDLYEKQSSEGKRTFDFENIAQYADIFVEIKVRKNSGVKGGYDFLASAKQIHDRRILANVQSGKYSKENKDNELSPWGVGEGIADAMLMGLIRVWRSDVYNRDQKIPQALPDVIMMNYEETKPPVVKAFTVLDNINPLK